MLPRRTARSLAAGSASRDERFGDVTHTESFAERAGGGADAPLRDYRPALRTGILSRLSVCVRTGERDDAGSARAWRFVRGVVLGSRGRRAPARRHWRSIFPVGVRIRPRCGRSASGARRRRWLPISMPRASTKWCSSGTHSQDVPCRPRSVCSAIGCATQCSSRARFPITARARSTPCPPIFRSSRARVSRGARPAS